MPLRSDWSGEPCPIARSLDVLGDPWALLVLRQALSGARRFEDFRASLGAADNVLASRLRALVDHGLLRRSPYRDGARTREEYVLTDAGAQTLPILNALALWGEAHRPHRDPDLTMGIVHRDCGRTTQSPDRCTHCGTALTPASTAWRKSWAPQDLALVDAG
ncbi:winged helix-turn-helix transcriptional regulator [Cellulomonas aerilata]|uniref:HxlR family transcriptional regulator n=1 Tax=Cellulomonas aerilata TaxID=515326 RepID=A0A512DGZ7_9CELL|nr:helix-turn-helix domain-containing protein [Cellulomonas aerilata]GEO35758.1 HxlR family transcriptional regulator [Cellulomonas aerilata]